VDQIARKTPRYFLLTVLVFWLPVAALASLIWNRVSRLDKKAFWYTVFLLTGLTTMMESIYVSTRIWTFSEKLDRLLGPRIRGVPIEEFSFWYGATPFMLLVYLTVRYLRRPKEEARC
jgi:lycopene cyclase domain-containing protein